MRRTALLVSLTLLAAMPAAFAQQAPTPSTENRTEEFRMQCGFLGVVPTNANLARLENREAPTRKGALLTEIVPSTGADRAGLLTNDIIVSFNGKAVNDETQLRRLVLSTAPGTMVPIEVMRGDQTLMVSAEITKRTDFGPCGCATGNVNGDLSGMRQLEQRMREAERQLRDAQRHLRESVREPGASGAVSARSEGWLGIAVQGMTEQLAKYFGVEARGALISDVRENSLAAAAGLRAGDVIVAVNGTRVNGPNEAVVSIRPAQTVDLLIIRDRQEQTITVSRNAKEPAAPQREDKAIPQLD